MNSNMRPSHPTSFLYFLERESELKYELDDIRSKLVEIDDELDCCKDSEKKRELMAMLTKLECEENSIAKDLKYVQIDIARLIGEFSMLNERFIELHPNKEKRFN